MGAVILSGIVTGVLYGLSGLALVVVYRASRVLNFGLGGIGGMAAYVAWNTIEGSHSYLLGYVLAIATGAALGLLADLLIARPLAHSQHLIIGIGLLGLLLILQGVIVWRWGVLTKALPPVGGTSIAFVAEGVRVTWNNIYVIGLGLIVTAGIAVLTLKTRFGLSMRATSAGPLTASVLGVHVSRVRQISWALSGALGALAALLVAPVSYLDPSSYTTFLFLTTVAVVMGGFTSIVGVFGGGIVFGIVVNLLETYLTTRLTQTFIFILILLILLVRPYGIFGRHESEISEPSLPLIRHGGQLFRSAGAWLRRNVARAGVEDRRKQRELATVSRIRRGYISTGSILVAVLIILSFIGPLNVRSLLPSVAAMYIVVLGLNMLGGYCGQLSVGHGAFVGIGAYAGAVLAHQTGIPGLATLPVAFVFAGIVGLILGLAATRLRSYLYLALLTLVFALIIPEIALRLGILTGGANGLPFPLPAVLMSSTTMLIVVYAAIAVFFTIAAALLIRSRIGRSWRAVRDSEEGAIASGIDPRKAKLSAFVLSAGYAGVGGAMLALSVGYISPDYYDIWLSVHVLAAVIVGGMASIGGSMIGALFITLVPLYAQQTPVPPDIVYGVALVLVLIAAPDGIGGFLSRSAASIISAFRWHRTAEDLGPPEGTIDVDGKPEPSAAMSLSAIPQDVRPDESTTSVVLELRDVSAGYGPVHVLESVSLIVHQGEIVTVLGANGAGKTTMLRAISGLIRPSSGGIAVLGHPVDNWPSYKIARLGVAQVVEGRGIFPDLSVEENIRLGWFGRPADRRREPEEIADVIGLFPDLASRLSQRAGTLSGGQLQMVAIARALAAKPELLMLDEPSLGLSPILADEVLTSLAEVKSTGVSVLLIEQNARRALEISDRGYLMSEGRIILEGPASELSRESGLVEAYLGVKVEPA